MDDAPLARDIARLVFANRWPLCASLALLAAIAALTPSLGWMGKAVLDSLDGDGDLFAALMAQGPLFAGVFALLTVLKVADKPVGKFVEARFIVLMQQIYLARRRSERQTQDISQMLYGCDVAKKGLKVAYDDVPVMAFTLISVASWQAALAPQWLPVMLLSAAPAALLVWFLGPWVRRASESMLDAQSGIAGTTSGTLGAALAGHQRDWIRRVVEMDLLKGLGEETMDLVIWTCFLALTLSLYASGSSLLPQIITPGDFALVIVNLKLVSDPLTKIGKIFIHWQEALPALQRVFRPAR
jgi:hypothetical protein